MPQLIPFSFRQPVVWLGVKIPSYRFRIEPSRMRILPLPQMLHTWKSGKALGSFSNTTWSRAPTRNFSTFSPLCRSK